MFNIKKPINWKKTILKVVLAINYLALLFTTMSIVICTLAYGDKTEYYASLFNNGTKHVHKFYLLGFATGAFAFLATNISFFFSGLNIERKWKDLKSFSLVQSGFIFTVSGLIPLYTAWTGYLLSLGKDSDGNIIEGYIIGGIIILLLFIAQIILGYYFIVRTNKGGPKNGQK